MLEAELGSAVERLRGAATLEERWRCVTGLMADFGSDQINYAVLNLAEAGRETASVTQFSNMDSTWIAHYLDRRLDLDDPHVAYARECNLQPYMFHARQADRLADPAQKSVIEQAAEAGLRSQISLVFPDRMRRGEPIGGMTIGSRRQVADFHGSVQGKEIGLMTLGMLFHSLSVGEVERRHVGAVPLSPRERDCLTYLALGLRVTGIAGRLSISEVMVEMHLRSARRKLRAATSAQAIARGLQFGDISL